LGSSAFHPRNSQRLGATPTKPCDGRSTDELIATLKDTYPGLEPAGDVHEFLGQLVEEGLLRDASVD
jgi:hypothetical protein